VETVLVSWSGGKDCALAMYDALVSGEYQVMALLTAVTKDSDRVDMHDIRWSLIERQAQAIGLPWEKVSISSHTSNSGYEPSLVQTLTRYKESGVTAVIFGDIFREDLRAYRTLNLARLGMKAVFPLWKRDNLQIMDSFISLGFKAIVTSINADRLDDRVVGKTIDWKFMREFPSSANICGEYGEYHTFVYDGPIFESPIPHTVGEMFEREDHFHRFKYCDVIPA
jgi:uncharacterized protein (TIGR00290 family)